MSIFSKTNNFVDKPKRNTFDLSFQNNLSMEFGKLYPVLCKEVIPGDSFNIDATFGLKFMPFYWPVQTRMKANLHFFYVRRRNLWKDFMDFWGNTKDNLVPPYLTFSDRSMLEVGELADYLGVPNYLYGSYGVGKFNQTLSFPTVDQLRSQSGIRVSVLNQAFPNITPGLDMSSEFASSISIQGLKEMYDNDTSNNIPYAFITSNAYFNFVSGVTSMSDVVFPDNTFRVFSYSSSGVFSTSTLTSTVRVILLDENYKVITTDAMTYTSGTGWIFSNSVTITMLQGAKYLAFYGSMYNSTIAYRLIPDVMSFSIYSDYNSGTGVEIAGNDVYNPYLPNANNPERSILVSAEPFRAYEAIYNSFYRNSQNNPYILSGVKEYNKFIPTNDGGPDSNSYKLHYRNWEQDFLTTATQTPQQGDFAPLVGVTSTGQLTFQSEDGTWHVQLSVANDGTVTGIQMADAGLPAGTLHNLVDSVSTGISINDFRNVNAFQRWLETNLRRGYKFKDQIMSHFGVEVKYDELNMPEFIGGCSQDVTVNQISNTNGDGSTPLGEYGAQASCVGTTRNVISHYFDEPGYVMAILSISPVPNYSQLIPKHLIKRNLFDYYFPEFGHIGMQPIQLKEVCPVQQFAADNTKLNDVFGYQRAWYDYLASTDEVHGYFRTSELRNFLVNRRFDVCPQLSEEFLLCDPSQVNDVFAVTDLTHKILGQVYFDIKAKRPIPEFGIPRLE